MLVLSIDTSGREGGVALARGGNSRFEVIGSATISGGTYSAQLVPRITNLLGAHKIAKTQIEGFAVASGPGSFTGLRVGIAAVKALAEALGKPIAAVSLLEAIAILTIEQQRKIAANDPDSRERQVRSQRLVALLDAGRDETYLGEYNWAAGQLSCVRELLLANADLLQHLHSFTAGVTVISAAEPQLADLLTKKDVSVIAVPRPSTEAIARIGIDKLMRGEAVPADTLDANYIRRSDAEIFSLPRLQHPTPGKTRSG
jgi:tRNA threonylcarbamoyladenosine biosynthesis protein TsaB